MYEDAFKSFYCLALRLGEEDLLMHEKHSLHAFNIKITIFYYADNMDLVDPMADCYSRLLKIRRHKFKSHLFEICEISRPRSGVICTAYE
jgi:hypothetical protein